MDEPLSERHEPSIAQRSLRDAADVSSALSSLLGEDPGAQRGVIHVAACFRAADGLLHVLKIGDASPKSESDLFLLQATRARAEVVVTTAEILRAEPHLSHELSGPHRDALRAYRTSCLGKASELEVVVLTRSGRLSPEHPAFHEATRVRVLAPTEAVAELVAAFPARVSIEPWSANSLRELIPKLCAEGRRTISVEAGPRSVRALYEPGLPVVDEVCLSIYEGGEVVEAAQGGALPADASLFAGLTRPHAPALVDEPSGRFRFMRWVKRT